MQNLLRGISGTANQISVSETSGAFTLSLPSSVYVSSLFIDNIEIDTAGATPNYVLAFNGTKFVPTASSGSIAFNDLTDVNLTSPQSGEILKYDGSQWINSLETGYNNSYASIIGDGTNSVFVITHNFGTRDIFVQCRNNNSPYENIEVRWEATTDDTVTLDFSTIPSSNSIRVNVYASVGVIGPSAFSQTIGDGTNDTFNIDHNMQTRDVIVSARNANSPYEVIEVNWKATTENRVEIIFSTPPASNTVRISVYAAGGVAGVTSLVGTTNEIEVSQTTGTVTVGLPNNVNISGNLTIGGDLVVNGDTTTINTATLSVEDNIITLNSNVTGIPITNAGIEVERGTSDNVQLRWDESSDVWKLSNNGTDYYEILSKNSVLDDINGVAITSATPGQFLKYNGSNWTNDDIPQINALDDIGDVSIATATAGQYLKFDGTNWVNDSIPIINSIDDIGDVDLTSPSTNQVLKYDGSNWVNSNLNAINGVSYVQTIGNGTDTSITITHNLNTRDIYPIFRQATSPYDVVNVYWEATTLNTLTAIFDSPPDSNSVRALIYSGFSASQGTVYSANIGNGSDTEITVTHNLNTRDILVSCRLNGSPYNDIQVSWEALTEDTVKLYFGEAPNSNEVRISVFANVSGSEVAQSVSSLTDTNISSPTNGQLLTWNGSSWVNDTLVTVTSLSALTDVSISSATPNQFLKWDGSTWVNANIPQINYLDDIADVNVSTAVSGELLKWNGSTWVNSDTVQNLTVSGNLTVNGNTTTISTTELLIEDNLIVLNTGSAATPSFNAGIEVERGDFTNVQIRWNESTDKWQFTNDGVTYKDLGSGGVTVSDTIPSLPAQGDMWYESDTGALFAYYDSQWIEIGGSAAYNEIIGTIQAKGDLLAGSASQSLTRLGVGSNGTRLAADSTTTTGLAWVSDAQNSVIDAKGDLLVGLSDNTVGKLSVGTNGQILVADSSQTSGIGWTEVNTRNLLYNGSMQVHQRGTSTESITSDGYYTADRWILRDTSLGTWTQSVENDAPTGSGFRKSLKVLCTTADASPAAADLLWIGQILEGQDLQSIRKGTSSAQQMTISFWVKSNVTGTYIFEAYDLDNGRQVSKPYTVSSSGVWEYKTIVVPSDLTGAFDNDNAGSLQLQWWLAVGSDRSSGALNTNWASLVNANRAVGQTNLASAINNYWQITGIQLNVGPVAAPFEFKPYGRELAECQRYYYLFHQGSGKDLGVGVTLSSPDTRIILPLPVQMRTVPLPDISTTSGYFISYFGASSSSSTYSSFDTGSSTQYSAHIIFNAGTATTGGATLVRTNNAATRVAFSADL